MDLAEFLLARIAEDEEAARACAGPNWQNGLPATIHPDPTTYRTVVRNVGHVCGSIIAADAEHIARWDPARVLAECEAKRRIVEQLLLYVARPDPSSNDPSGTQALWIVKTLALPYADHPDYRREWVTP